MSEISGSALTPYLQANGHCLEAEGELSRGMTVLLVWHYTTMPIWPLKQVSGLLLQFAGLLLRNFF